MEEAKKRIFSGIQPSGILTIGNYLGALKNWVGLQEDYECIYCVVNMHAITVRQVPADLRRHTYEALAVYLAAGIDPKKSTIFVQSHVPAHAELAWVLNCNTMFGELSRMTQFKDKSAKHGNNINAGLFTYPTLMAADILLYQAALVPVGQDQKQHVELTRDIAQRMNGVLGNLFTMPECLFPKAGAKIMALTDPTKKMSKSDPNPKSYVAVLDPKDTVIKKFKSAVTDSGSGICRAEGKEGIGNLMTIYSAFTGKSDEEITAEFEGRGYGDFKLAVGETVADVLAPVRERFAALMRDRAYLDACCAEGLEQAMRISQRTRDKVYKKIGFFL